MTFATTCSCGDEMKVEANSKEEAIEKLKVMMNPEAVAKHMAEKHSGQTPNPDDMVTLMKNIHIVE